MARYTERVYRKLSAVTSGVKDVRSIVEQARNALKLQVGTHTRWFAWLCTLFTFLPRTPSFAQRRRTVLFVDEIHRFNKAQQDAFLPHVESGLVTLIGATTENPSFALNSALLSRCRVVVLRKLTQAELMAVLDRAVCSAKGLGGWGIRVSNDVRKGIASVADGDARSAMNALELAAQFTVGVFFL